MKSGHRSPWPDQSDAFHTLGGETYQDFSSGICVPEITGDNDTQTAAYPLPYNTSDPPVENAKMSLIDEVTAPGIMCLGISRDEITTISDNTSHYRLFWIELPQP